MTENKDENPNPEPWKDMPEIDTQARPYECLGVPYEKFRGDVEPVVLDTEFWSFCSSIDTYDDFLITGGQDLRALQESKEVDESKSFSREPMKAVEPSANPFYIVPNDNWGYPTQLLYRFLDGGYALVGNLRSEVDLFGLSDVAHLQIVPLSELTDHKLFLSYDSLLKERRIHAMQERVRKFKYFTADWSVVKLRTPEKVSDEEMDSVIQHLYKSDQAAAIHRAALYFQHRERKKEDPLDPEEAPE